MATALVCSWVDVGGLSLALLLSRLRAISGALFAVGLDKWVLELGEISDES